jgi:hypothetical protein
MSRSDRNRLRLPLEETVIVEPFDIEKFQADFEPWATLKARWPKKAPLLLKLDDLARQQYVDLCLRPQDLAPVELIFDTLRGYGIEMGKRLLEWLAIDGQACDKNFISAVRTDVHAIFNYERRFWDCRLPLKAQLAVKHEYRQRLHELATRASKACLDPLELEAAKTRLNALSRVENARGVKPKPKSKAVKKRPRKFQKRLAETPASIQNDSQSRRTAVDEYISEVLQKTGKRITRKDIYTAAGYTTQSDFQKWQRAVVGYSENSADRNIQRILLVEKPHLIKKTDSMSREK